MSDTYRWFDDLPPRPDSTPVDRLRDLFLSAPVSTPGAIDVDIEAVIATLGSCYDADEAGVIARVLRAHGGTVPDCYGPEYEQLISEVGLALRRMGDATEVGVHEKEREMAYVLINAAKMHEERPELLSVLPTQEELDSVGVNDYVRLIFSYGGGTIQMWVKIVTRGDGGARGILIGVPVSGMPLEIGAMIEFGLGDIARVIPEDEAEAQKGT